MRWLFFIVPLFISCKEEAPVIVSIEPRIGTVGEVLTVYGNYFGDDRGASYITIAGIPPTAASYLSWRNDQIRIKIPEFGGAGLVYVHRDGKKSNPLLLSNRGAIPEFMPNSDRSLGPIITAVKPAAGSIDSLVTIEGSGFGSSREKSGVFFTWQSETPPSAPAPELQPNMIEVFEAEFGYELWSDREIRVRVPDGAVTGNLEVRTPRKNSSPVLFTVIGRPGTKTFKEKRNYTISYTVDIRVQEAEPPNTLYLWVPQPAVSASQRIPEPPSRTIKPFVENYQGTALFQLTDLKAEAKANIGTSYIVDVYAVETDLKNQPLKPNGSSPIQAVHTTPSVLIPSDDPAVIAHAKTLIGKEQNPYEKARKIYDWLTKEIQYAPSNNGVLETLEQKQGDSYSASLLFCALARSADIPAIPIAGVLVTGSRLAVRHYWAEFWIDGFGWVPLDPALGAGAAPPDVTPHREPGAYYFGNLDNQRIAFSRGLGTLSQMDPHGRITARHREYALQNLWEEAAGGLEAYSSLWSGITITGMYAQ
jgi:transglutaminase-like putative cysteine protease